MSKGHSAPEDAFSLAEAVGRGAGQAELRNRFRKLDEAMSRGSALSLSSLARSGAGDVRRGSWAAVYSSREREIRAALRGSIGTIKESLPSARFRVLASEHAPDDLSRYLPDLKESSSHVADMYQALVSRCDALVDGARSASSRYMTPSESVLHGNVVWFAESVRDDAVEILGELRTVIGSSGSDCLATLARAHDLCSDGLEDFTIAVSFAEETLTQTGERP